MSKLSKSSADLSRFFVETFTKIITFENSIGNDLQKIYKINSIMVKPT